ncbi:MAG TPA: hypothetical protein VF974_01725 [Patescibacteria group bacterium]
MTTMEKSHKLIDVAVLVAPIIGSRDVANQLKHTLDQIDAKSVDLDFAKVDFVSRSAAHALLVMKEDFNRQWLNKKAIHFINTNNDIEQMFKVVATTHVLDKRAKPEFKPQEVDIDFLYKNL